MEEECHQLYHTEMQNMRGEIDRRDTTLKEKDELILKLERMVSNAKAFNMSVDLSSVDLLAIDHSG